MNIKVLLKNFDIWLGSSISLKFPAYINETILYDGNGIYTQEEWSKARSRGYNNIGNEMSELDNISDYIKRILGLELRKTLSGYRFAKAFDFNPNDTVMELGCGEMITGLAVKSVHNNIHYIATDFDHTVIEKCKKLSILDDIDKEVIDIKQMSVEKMKGINVMVAWDVFYAFSHDELDQLFRKISEANVRLVVATSQFIGPLNWLVFYAKNLMGYLRGNSYKIREKAGLLRAHGMKYSIAYLKMIAIRRKLKTKIISFPLDGYSSGDVYVMVCFSKI